MGSGGRAQPASWRMRAACWRRVCVTLSVWRGLPNFGHARLSKRHAHLPAQERHSCSPFDPGSFHIPPIFQAQQQPHPLIRINDQVFRDSSSLIAPSLTREITVASAWTEDFHDQIRNADDAMGSNFGRVTDHQEVRLIDAFLTWKEKVKGSNEDFTVTAPALAFAFFQGVKKGRTESKTHPLMLHIRGRSHIVGNPIDKLPAPFPGLPIFDGVAGLFQLRKCHGIFLRLLEGAASLIHDPLKCRRGHVLKLVFSMRQTPPPAQGLIPPRDGTREAGRGAGWKKHPAPRPHAWLLLVSSPREGGWSPPSRFPHPAPWCW